MDILYQYYNEIVLGFADYEVDLRNGTILILVPENNKPFDTVCEKILQQINRIAGTLEPRDKVLQVRIERGLESRELVFDQEDTIQF